MVASQTNDVVLQRDLERYKQDHPGSTQHEAISNAVRFTIPASIAGSPSKWREELHNLVRRVQVCVMMPCFAWDGMVCKGARGCVLL
jgi:hypothetical protein